MTTPQIPLPGEPGATADELGGTIRAPHPGSAAGARCDDPGSGAALAAPGIGGGGQPTGRCCSCRDIEDDADPGCVLHGDPAVNGTADYSRPGDPTCITCGGPVRRHAGSWWLVGWPWTDDHVHRPRQDGGAELPYETTLDEDERHDR